MEISAVTASSRSIEQVNNAMKRAVEMTLQTDKKLLKATVSLGAASATNQTTSQGVNTIA